MVVATADTDASNLARLSGRFGAGIRIWPVTRAEVLRVLEARFAEALLDAATFTLERRYPEFSARSVITAGQAVAFGLVAALTALAFCVAPAVANWVLTIALSLAFIANALFRILLVWIGAMKPQNPAMPLSSADASHLPRYSVIVPLHKEANVVTGLIRALRALDYPPDRLEVALVLEADDRETIAAVEAEPFDPRFFVLHVPPGSPRTKPKAANYALGFVRGEFTVIYDAEDRPEQDQLLKAVAAFRSLPQTVACLQARLNFYNARENWLTRMFALDYALWFDFLLPGLDKYCIPMPLGGTSNHFRTEALRAIAGWDPCNVTEDADIGIRLAQLGLRVTTLDSTTFEEATVTLGIWLRQRSRWMKGYMQTWLVHMRTPLRLLRQSGPRGFFGFQLFVGGTFLTALLNPVLWCIWLLTSVRADAATWNFAIQPFAVASLASVVVGNALFVYLAILGPWRRGWLDLSPYGLGAPIYWALISAASYRGLWQLVTRPRHWDKTRHGMTRHLPVQG